MKASMFYTLICTIGIIILVCYSLNIIEAKLNAIQVQLDTIQFQTVNCYPHPYTIRTNIKLEGKRK